MTKHALWGAMAAVCAAGAAHAQLSPGAAAVWVSQFPIPPASNSSASNYVPGYVVEEYDPSVGYPRVTSPTHPLDVNVVSGGSGGGGTASTVNQGTAGTSPWPVLDSPSPITSAASTLSMATAGTAYTIANAGYGTLSVSISGLSASGGSVTFKASDNGSTYYVFGGFNGAGNTRYTTATADGSYTFSIAGRTQTQIVVATAGTGSLAIGYTLTAAARLVGLDTSPAGPAYVSEVVNGAVVASGNPVPVGGTVAVSALPALPAGTNALGSVSVSNLPTTQAVSVVALPLPAGAATAANQTPAVAAGTSAAVAMPVQGTAGGVPLNTAIPTLTYSASAYYSAGTTSSTLFAAATFARTVLLCTLPASTSNVWLNLAGGTAAVGSGVPVFKGGGCTSIGTQALPMPNSAVTSITDGTAAQALSVTGG